MKLFLAIYIFSIATLSYALAGEADVIDAKARIIGEQLRISVTVKHDDEGWDHYADRWDIIAPNGDILGERILFHPHVNEQPFTRSHTIKIPENITSVTIQAHDNIHGLGGKTLTIPIEE